MTRNRHIQLLTIEYAANARGVVKTHSYEQARGLLLGTTYSDGTTARTYSYNHLGMLTQVTDDAGIRTIGYNTYNEEESDNLLADGKTHLVTELRDVYGRSSGYTYANNGALQHTVSIGYGADGRIASAGFVHGGAQKLFTYSYLPGTNLLQTLVKPNNMTLTQSYEEKRDLLISQLYMRSNTTVASRFYSYDLLGRPTTRSTSKDEAMVNDSFVYNSRSELNIATVSNETYAYGYDNIGNRVSAQEAAKTVIDYATNSLNQYTNIDDFVPSFDDAGNQTTVKTNTGIWSVVYNAETRPTSFTNADSGTVVESTYDYMGRRATKKVTVNGSVTLYQRYIYRGYLQIACVDLTRSTHPALWFITWDPTQTVATRPLAIQINGTWFTYGWDLTKNICEVYGQHGYTRSTYTYTPYGAATMSGNLTQPVQWSSEFYDAELALVYYNYRHYNPTDGRWLGRDTLEELQDVNVYRSYFNAPTIISDVLGNYDFICDKMHRNWYKDFNIQIIYKSIDKEHTFVNINDIPEAIENELKNWVKGKIKEKISDAFKNTELYKNLMFEYGAMLSQVKQGVKKIKIGNSVMKFLYDMNFVAFIVKIDADFCCCKKGKYYFKKISNINQTQGNGHSLTDIRGWIEFEKLLKELPSIFARTSDEVITLGLNCCKD